MKNTKNYLLLLLFLIAFLVVGDKINAQTEETAKKYGITYPIAELGNCGDYSSCRTYCDDETHKEICIAFAKKKGFYKEDPLIQKKAVILAASKSELGCDSPESCKKKCEDESNFEKCTEFAKKYGLGGGQMLSDKNNNILSKAKELLDCDSPSSCKAICEREENRHKCSEFAKQTGLRGGEQMKGPGGCNSKETCQAFCSDPNNFNDCKKFGQKPDGKGDEGGQAGSFKGPGGCDSKESCEKYCRENVNECRKFGGEPKDKNTNNPDKFCQENPDKCKEMRQNFKEKQEDNRDDFCRQNPDKCKEQFGKPEEQGNRDPDFCKNNPDKCQERFGKPDELGKREEDRPPDDFCQKNPDRCKRPAEANQENRKPPENIQNQGDQIDHSKECSNRGCNWNGETCVCSNKESNVKGVSTFYGFFLQKLLYLILKVR
ncbi:MAG: hypothetical protein US11_C0001G0008 [Candidatus Roizmanbacteria bacterium GW2011_GWA2_36_23]|uniref:Uncharacterized protein n=1 Tax=Candidatus Roizmanbacteria bacterium GW2011_GWA2_36_23 TaxID=1618480 RepID=A0A0G0GQH2_9BACT|nr:MAG: hypothetical protein US11_C0001G0008 [Candidatus Roizmanbacteria bacterium GW2011_GWA2_36_23]